MNTERNGNGKGMIELDIPDLQHRQEDTPIIDAIMARGGVSGGYQEVFQTAQPVLMKRNLAEVERRLLEESRIAGEDFYYSFPAGKDVIEGPSVKMTNAAARCWGNCVIKPGLIQELSDSWVLTMLFVDLETGYTVGRQFRQSKDWMVYGRFDDARKDDIRFQIGQSKAIRNLVRNALPEFLFTRAMKAAKSGVTEKINAWVKSKGIVPAVDLFLKTMGNLGVTEEAVLAKLQIADRKAITIEHLVTLSGDKNAIESGQMYAVDLFPALRAPDEGKDAPKAGDLKSRMRKAKVEEKKAEPPKAAEPEKKPPVEEKLKYEPGDANEDDEPPTGDMKNWSDNGDASMH
jgi:hypothetical protein